MDRIFSGAKAVASRFTGGGSKAQQHRSADVVAPSSTMESKSAAHNRGGEDYSHADEIIYKKGWLYTFSADGDVVQRYCILRNFGIEIHDDENAGSEVQVRFRALKHASIIFI
jgi:sporulation-control protein spo0M